MKIFLTYQERMAGLFILFAVVGVVAFVGGAAVQNRWLSPRVTYFTQVHRGDGLRKGSPVLVSGIEVGEVGDVRILGDDRIDVELRVLSQHAVRVRHGVTAEVRRVLGIGEKRVHLVAAGEKGPPIAPGSEIASSEPLDLLDAVSAVDLDHISGTMGRVVNAMEQMLGKLEEKDRLERMVQAFDEMAPTMTRINHLLAETDETLISLINDPNLPKTFRGAARLLNDPATRKLVRGAAETLEPKEIKQLLSRTNKTLVQLDALLAPGSHLQGTLKGADKLVNDGRIDRMMEALERLSDADKLGKLVDNLAILAHQMAKIGPQIPSITREMMVTLREAVIVLKALQKTWILEDEAGEVRKQMRKKR